MNQPWFLSSVITRLKRLFEACIKLIFMESYSLSDLFRGKQTTLLEVPTLSSLCAIFFEEDKVLFISISFHTNTTNSFHTLVMFSPFLQLLPDPLPPSCLIKFMFFLSTKSKKTKKEVKTKIPQTNKHGVNFVLTNYS